MSDMQYEKNKWAVIVQWAILTRHIMQQQFFELIVQLLELKVALKVTFEIFKSC